MGKRPLTGAIGLLGVSVFLAGCNCCKPNNNKQAFMNDRADSSLGVTKSMTSPGWKNKPQSSVAGTSGASGNGYDSMAGSPSGRGLDSAGAGSGMSSGMGGMPSMPSAGMQPTSSIPPVPGTSMANPPSGGASLNESTASLSALPPAASSSSGATSGSILTTSNHLNDATSVKTADYKVPIHNVDGGVKQAAMGMDDAGYQPVPPTPPMTALTRLPSSTTSKTPMTYPPTPAPTPDATASMGNDPALDAPAPRVSAPTAPRIPATGANATPTSMGSFPPGVN